MFYQLLDITLEDLKLIYDWRNQEHIRKVMYNQQIIKWEDHLKWYENILENPLKISKIFKIDNEPLGIVNINNIDWNNKCCEWGFYIGNSNAPKGAGLILGYAAIEFLINELGLNKVIGEVIEYNTISKNFHVRLGFGLDGILRQHIYQENKFEDVYVYSLLKNEWQLVREKIKQELMEKFKEL